jgi:hypothetical protein
MDADAEGSLRGDVLFYSNMSKGGFAGLTMMGYGGQERSEREMYALLDSAGLRPVRVVGQAWTLSVIEVRAA